MFAMEMGSKLPQAAEVMDLIQKAAQEFESSQRGVVITSDRVTVVGRTPSVVLGNLGDSSRETVN